MKKNLITIKCFCIGSCEEIALMSGSELNDLLELHPQYRREESIRLMGKNKPLDYDYKFNDGDVVLLSSSVSGEALLSNIDKGLIIIQEFLLEAGILIVADPYFFSGQNNQKQEAVTKFSSVADWSTLKYIHVITDQRKINNHIYKGISDNCKDNKCNLSVSYSSEIHDRVWVKNNSSALSVGTSLNGIGKRLAFANILPEEDLEDFMVFLKEYDLLPNGT